MDVRDDHGFLLKATASFELRDEGFDIVVASRSGRKDGPTARNPDYERLVEALLVRAGALGVPLQAAVVESDDTSHLAREDRLLSVPGRTFPIALDRETDIARLRTMLWRSMGGIGRRPDARGPGNRNKKVRIEFGSPTLSVEVGLEPFLSGAVAVQDFADAEWTVARRRIELMTRQTVARSGQVQVRILKNKELRCADLEQTLNELAHVQGFCCRQTGVAFVESDPELRASLDRLDSDGHYEDGSLADGVHNLQLVTHWYNIAKGTRSDAQMHRLLEIHAKSHKAAQIVPTVSTTMKR